jgi:transglutaminase-like putative cysteine protease
MRLQVIHNTHYQYAPPIDSALHLAYLRPIDRPTQQVISSELLIDPAPAWQDERQDVYGNWRLIFSLPDRHDQLRVVATSCVQTQLANSSQPNPFACCSWQQARDYFQSPQLGSRHPAKEFVFASPYVAPHEDFAAFAHACFTPDQSLLQATIDLMRRIHEELTYTSNSTDIYTPALQALAARQGVCQDFAHIMLGCLRTLGLPARYVSGYLLSGVAEDQTRLIGSDASHAWVSVLIPGEDPSAFAGQWVDFDPTNNRWGVDSPGEDYVSLAMGRDFGDISPLRGVLAGSVSQLLDVGVKVTAVP